MSVVSLYCLVGCGDAGGEFTAKITKIGALQRFSVLGWFRLRQSSAALMNETEFTKLGK